MGVHVDPDDAANVARRAGLSPTAVAEAIRKGAEQALRRGLDLDDVVLVLSPGVSR